MMSIMIRYILYIFLIIKILNRLNMLNFYVYFDLILYRMKVKIDIVCLNCKYLINNGVIRRGLSFNKLIYL